MAGHMVQVTGATVDTTDNLALFAGLQKAFVVNGAILGVVDFSNTMLTVAAMTTPPARGDILTQATHGGIMVVDFVNAAKTAIYGFTTTDTLFNADHTFASNNAGATMNPAAITPSVVAEGRTMPLWYGWTKYSGTTGDMPAKAYLGCFYRGRCVLSGNPASPHQWYMSRQLNPFDWTYGANDAQSPVTGGQGEVGQVGDIVKALIPRNDDYMLFGCATSMWLLQGDPCSGGQMSPIDTNTGIFGGTAWTWDAKGNLWFWGTNGIYRMELGKGVPQCMSLIPLPDLVKDEAANPTTHRISMGVDTKRGGIFISITVLATGVNSCYWYDTRTEGFFPETYHSLNGAYSLLNYQANADADKGLLVGCTDGYIRRWDNATANDMAGDVATAISSRAVLGLIPADPKSLMSAIINDVHVEVSGGIAGGSETASSPVTVKLYAANLSEHLLDKITDASPDIVTTSRPLGPQVTKKNYRLGGRYFAVELQNNTLSQSWAVENVILNEGK